MKDRNVEKLLYKVAAVLVLSGIVIRLFILPENFLGLYLTLSGLITGVAAIFLHMKYINELEQKEPPLEKEQLKKG
ncbi:hypothetical protein GCM10023188_42010 [Pontibacter saemangeumensis]|uniref:Uncharacterized protein n=1 Tax=Pontibacter saemangeumensis TaxID=1084525 RepID=A0ABP8M344_9BACT